MDMIGVEEERIKPGMQIEIERGHFYETGLGYAINRLNPWILAPDKYGEGLKRLKQVVHSGGHTTIGDLATGLFDFDSEVEALSNHLEGDEVPFRTRLVAHGTILGKGESPEKGPRINYLSLIVTAWSLADILNYSVMELFSVSWRTGARVFDGHFGEWLATPEV